VFEAATVDGRRSLYDRYCIREWLYQGVQVIEAESRLLLYMQVMSIVRDGDVKAIRHTARIPSLSDMLGCSLYLRPIDFEGGEINSAGPMCCRILPATSFGGHYITSRKSAASGALRLLP
jgi:hypothetical protein